MHGMPLGFLLNLVDKSSSFPSMQWFKPCLQPKDVVYIGLRDLDEPEKASIKRLGIKTTPP
jgi:arginase